MNQSPEPDPETAAFNVAQNELNDGFDYRALASASALVARYPNNPRAFVIAAQATQNLGLIGEAKRFLDDGLERFPGQMSLTYIRALWFLANGDFSAGWKDYELRLKLPQRCNLPRRVNFKRWQGEPLADRSILIWGEQGFGDEIMFASMIPDLASLGARITFECSRELRALFARSFEPLGVRVIGHDLDGSMPIELSHAAFDYETPIASCARFLRPNRDAFVPYARPYLTAANGVGFPKFAPNKKVIGLAWRGGIKITRRAARTIPLEYLSELKSDDTVFIILQHDATDREHEALTKILPNTLFYGKVLQSLDAQAAIVADCDAVIAACGTIVHLTGALGKPVFVMSPHVPEWRYGFRKMLMPWYQQAFVIRQEKYNDWSRVPARAIGAALDRFPL